MGVVCMVCVHKHVVYVLGVYIMCVWCIFVLLYVSVAVHVWHTYVFMWYVYGEYLEYVCVACMHMHLCGVWMCGSMCMCACEAGVSLCIRVRVCLLVITCACVLVCGVCMYVYMWCAYVYVNVVQVYVCVLCTNFLQWKSLPKCKQSSRLFNTYIDHGYRDKFNKLGMGPLGVDKLTDANPPILHINILLEREIPHPTWRNRGRQWTIFPIIFLASLSDFMVWYVLNLLVKWRFLISA